METARLIGRSMSSGMASINFVDITRPKFAVQAIRKAAQIGWKPPLHVLNNVSVSVGTVMQPAGFDASQGILSSYYMKDPTDPQCKSDPGMKEWNAFMDKYYPTRTELMQRSSTPTQWLRLWSMC